MRGSPVEEPGVDNLKARAKALPPLGRALDMRGSHPVERRSRTGRKPFEVVTPHDRAFSGRISSMARFSDSWQRVNRTNGVSGNRLLPALQARRPAANLLTSPTAAMERQSPVLVCQRRRPGARVYH
jgi:hypothetical protein